MKKVFYLMATFCFIVSLGCSSSPTTPSRESQGFESGVLTFQMALYLADNNLGDPKGIPTDIPVSELISPDKFPLFSRYVLAAFDIYDWGPGDWDDWLVKLERSAQDWEPGDWDDWLIKTTNYDVNAIRAGHVIISTDHLKSISSLIDPLNLYQPVDWFTWMILNDWEPGDWDDWLVRSTVIEIAAIN